MRLMNRPCQWWGRVEGRLTPGAILRSHPPSFTRKSMRAAASPSCRPVAGCCRNDDSLAYPVLEVERPLQPPWASSKSSLGMTGAS